MTRTPTKLFDQLSKIERDLQSLKFEAYRQFGWLSKKKSNGKMTDEAIVRAVRSVRKKLWKEKYAHTL